MAEEGDRIIFPTVGSFEDPNTGNQVVGERFVSDTVTDSSQRAEGSGDLFGPTEGELEIETESTGRTNITDIGDRVGGKEVAASDVFIEPANFDPQPIGEASVELQRDRTQPQTETQSTTTQRGRAWSDLGYDDPSPPADGLQGANIGRYENTGTFADEPPVVATEANQLRDPHTGEFLGQEVEATDPRIDRDPETGEFQKERSGRESLGVLDGDLFF